MRDAAVSTTTTMTTTTDGDADAPSAPSEVDTATTTTTTTTTAVREDAVVSVAADDATSDDADAAVPTTETAAEEGRGAQDAREVAISADGATAVTPEPAVPVPAVVLPNDNGTTRPVVDVSDAQVAALEDYLQTGFGLVHDDGVDSEGVPVVTVNVTRIPGWAGSGDRARSMQLLTKALTHVAEKGEYSVVVYFGCDDRAKGVVPSGAVQWLRDIHDSLPRTSKKNVKKVVFVNVPFLASALISVTMPFVSAKAAKKFVWAKSLEDMDKATNYHLSVNHCGERFKRSIQYVGADAQTMEPTPVQ
uniref:CRAL-TRIO domain-containing protein n=1 Tax=Ostreococcus mediterraneus TaxID=1486918 RepID=A0A7S0Z7U3_9CHLO